MKTHIYDITGKEKSEISLPKEFSAQVREDIVAKVLEAKKRQQSYAPSPVAGKQHSASGKIKHRRHVWKTHYGHGISRIPRKIVLTRGNRFNWIGAEISSAVGGRRAHPPKLFSRTKKINKKEMKIAFASALSATANEKYVLKKYSSLDKRDKKVPFVISISGKIKTKDFLDGLKKILGKELYNVAIRKKSIRAGKGTMRGRKYKSNAGMLFVVSNAERENVKTKMFEVKTVNELGVADLAKGGLGRLTIYTEKAVADLDKKLEGKND